MSGTHRLAELLEAVESETAQGGRTVSYAGLGWLWLDLGPRRRRDRTEPGGTRTVEALSASARRDPRVVPGRVLRFGGADWTVVGVDDGQRPGRAELALERTR